MITSIYRKHTSCALITSVYTSQFQYSLLCVVRTLLLSHTWVTRLQGAHFKLSQFHKSPLTRLAHKKTVLPTAEYRAGRDTILPNKGSDVVCNLCEWLMVENEGVICRFTAPPRIVQHGSIDRWRLSTYQQLLSKLCIHKSSLFCTGLNPLSKSEGLKAIELVFGHFLCKVCIWKSPSSFRIWYHLFSLGNNKVEKKQFKYDVKHFPKLFDYRNFFPKDINISCIYLCFWFFKFFF